MRDAVAVIDARGTSRETREDARGAWRVREARAGAAWGVDARRVER